MNLPRMLTIRQSFRRSAPLDVRLTVQSQLALKFAGRIAPKSRIAVAVGSRGIANLGEIILATVQWLRLCGAEPFIVPAMGSHGGATSEGQAALIADYGITETALGVPIASSMAATLIGRTDDGVDVYISSDAL